MQRVCWFLTLIFAAASLVLAYVFLIRGATAPASDGRTAVLMSPGERDLVLAEMRGFLEAVQRITAAVSRDDAAAVTAAAWRVGAAAQRGVPASLAGKLPVEFKTLGFDTHERFDQLAMDAEQFGDTGVVLPAFAELMNNCVGCHAVYRIDLEDR